jgi:hypothetical protein
MVTLIHQRVEAARAGTNPTVICRMPSGWAVLGDAQFLRGYSLLLADPVVADLNSLDEERRRLFLRDMAILGDALCPHPRPGARGHRIGQMVSATPPG